MAVPTLNAQVKLRIVTSGLLVDIGEGNIYPSLHEAVRAVIKDATADEVPEVLLIEAAPRTIRSGPSAAAIKIGSSFSTIATFALAATRIKRKDATNQDSSTRARHLIQPEKEQPIRIDELDSSDVQPLVRAESSATPSDNVSTGRPVSIGHPHWQHAVAAVRTQEQGRTGESQRVVWS